MEKIGVRKSLDAKITGNLNIPAAQKIVLKHISASLKEFPGYAQIRRVCLYLDSWTLENGLLTPTLKIKRAQILERFSNDIEKIYASLGA